MGVYLSSFVLLIVPQAGGGLYVEIGGKITFGIQAMGDIGDVEAIIRPLSVTLIGGSVNNKTGRNGELLIKNGNEIINEFGVGIGFLSLEGSQQFITSSPQDYLRTIEIGFLFIGGLEFNWDQNGFQNWFIGVKVDPKVGFIIGAEGLFKFGYQSGN
ncbi:MAG TPA: hypothetical protein DCQ26_19165 [Marinilabiliales bacterium]|nr:MAG: hypothetical protein A2W95_09965 [Bacteroidetes bacterium GWA2_40_14]OFX64944.1 MAG: hypothetical protein A2W84_11635 [Bacteroidetes bacterium GWC2_40_13]OFX72502.1 MAG: hypothetical protein A2W96_05540 [Bacteroidetes bacterium GWD2_40_43]OFX90586.1 MAG: hypothetical protein A2W97_02310 [Bacteroidetes bacterium GWE2_40_63]OFY20936.1 MAG: hypothetical protein A2W88_17950 [Bacteroidetes bacterium GWF2_40_13]OFZ23645.1 MAG: hypothetical protein A2437_06280 [Bacteroidetes bacterium RIFOXYC